MSKTKPSPSHKKDLATQEGALWAYCLEQSLNLYQWREAIGFALNYKRKGFNQIIEDIELGHVKRLVIFTRISGSPSSSVLNCTIQKTIL